MEIKKQTLTNEQAVELFSILNGLDLKDVKGSHLEYSVVKTLRKMKEWQQSYAEKVKDIQDDNCARIKDESGVEILQKKKMTKTEKRRDGSMTSDEYEVNVYTPEGEKKKTKELRDYNKAAVSIKFEIHSTSDGKILTEYERLALEELGFYIPEVKKEASA